MFEKISLIIYMLDLTHGPLKDMGVIMNVYFSNM